METMFFERGTLKILISFFAMCTIIILLANPAFANKSDAYKNQDVISLKEKLAKNYSRKFCNAIGIGMSKESAARLSIAENKNPKFNPSIWLELKLSKSNPLQELAKEDLIREVSSEISNECGYPIGIKSKEDLSEFEKFFIGIEESMSDVS